MIIVKPRSSLHPDDWQYENPDVPLQEMAYPRKKVEFDLTKFEETMFTHLLKIFYYRDFEQYLRGWIVTVFKCAFRMHKVKAPKGKKDYFLSAEDIYELLWGGRIDVFLSHHDGTIKDFNYKANPEYAYLPYVHAGGDVEGAEQFMKAYYIWLARNLSKNGKVTLADVQYEIETLLRKYPL
jgi:hypothetical protein